MSMPGRVTMSPRERSELDLVTAERDDALALLMRCEEDRAALAVQVRATYGEVAEEVLTSALHPEFGYEWRKPDGRIWQARLDAFAEAIGVVERRRDLLNDAFREAKRGCGIAAAALRDHVREEVERR